MALRHFGTIPCLAQEDLNVPVQDISNGGGGLERFSKAREEASQPPIGPKSKRLGFFS